ncbi:MAG: hypothetical protein PHD36_02975 [Desulfotomaculaceae bacterium]|nr:hypothetical protein [Desulfotomaculaceae bacterium]
MLRLVHRRFVWNGTNYILEAVDERLPILFAQPIKNRNIILQPLIEAVNIEPCLSKTELVIVGGEYGMGV